VLEGYRRQFYVGMTRAKSNLHLVSNYKVEGKYVNRVNKDDFKFNYKDKFWHGRASNFIQELGL
jgi:superfamily I DNA/RNA helicase